jgi:hypothetical protein
MIPAEIVSRTGEHFRLVTRLPEETKTHVFDVRVHSESGDYVGFLHMGHRRDIGWYLEEIRIYRRKRCGLGSALLEIAEAHGRELGFDEIHGVAMATDPSGEEREWLLDWYRRKGYVITYEPNHPREEYLGTIWKKL